METWGVFIIETTYRLASHGNATTLVCNQHWQYVSYNDAEGVDVLCLCYVWYGQSFVHLGY